MLKRNTLITTIFLLLSVALAAFGQSVKPQDNIAAQASLVSEFDVNGMKVLLKRRANSPTIAGGRATVEVEGGARRGCDLDLTVERHYWPRRDCRASRDRGQAGNARQRFGAAEGMDAPGLSDPTWRDQMKATGETRSQAFARRLRTAGYNGLLVRRFAPGATADDPNLVLWRCGAAAPSRLVPIDDENRPSR